MVRACLVLAETTNLLYTVAATSCILNSVGEFPLFHILPSTDVVSVLDFGCSNRCVVISCSLEKGKATTPVSLPGEFH